MQKLPTPLAEYGCQHDDGIGAAEAAASAMRKKKSMRRRRRVDLCPSTKAKARCRRQENALPNGNKALAKHRSINTVELTMSAVTEAVSATGCGALANLKSQSASATNHPSK